MTTDIKLGGSAEKGYATVAASGGLYVIGTNRFESRRIDDQLRGRSGRQGDPGMSRFIISFEDELFIKYRINDLIPAQLIPKEKDVIENETITREVNRLQRIIEGQHGDIKATQGKFSHLTEKQRQIIAEYRQSIVNGE